MIALFAETGVLPLVVLVAWPLLWWRGNRRLRLWFAVLAPAALVAGLFISGAAIGRSGDHSCLMPPCEPDVRSFTGSVDSASWLGLPLTLNCLLALLIGAPLGIATVIADLVLQRDDRRNAAADPAA